jgi:hypothetical protein
MSEWDWLNLDLGSGEGYGTVLAPYGDTGGGASDWVTGGTGGWGYDPTTLQFSQNPLYEGGAPGGGGWGYDPATGQFSQSPVATSGGGEGGGTWLSTILGGLGSVGSFLGTNAGVLGPLLSGAGALGGGALGANASQDAARLQADALNRGMDLQTAQWLQQQANQAPWLQAGQQALPQLQQLAGQAQPQLQQTAPRAGTSAPMGGVTPGWQPTLYGGYQQTATPHAANYAYQPGQGPQAAAYRYQPGQTPDAGAYRYTPGSAPRAADYRYTPGAVPTLSGQELLANDPGVAFRLQEGRNALEASAAARGGALSGPALAALQRQGQELSSQEYGNAWNRAAQQAQMREGWQQVATQQGFGQAAQEAQMREGWGQQASQMGFGQAMSAAQLREQVNQVASQQGWSQAQAEAAFREQLAQQAGTQNWGQAAQEAQLRAQQQQFGWNAGFQTQRQGQQEAQSYEQQLYDRLMQQNQLQYGRDWQQREAENQRMTDLYNSQVQGQNTQWNRYAGLSGTGQTTAGQLGEQGAYNSRQMGSLLSQLGTAQGLGTLGAGQSWMTGLSGLNTGIQGLLKNLNQ